MRRGAVNLAAAVHDLCLEPASAAAPREGGCANCRDQQFAGDFGWVDSRENRAKRTRGQWRGERTRRRRKCWVRRQRQTLRRARPARRGAARPREAGVLRRPRHLRRADWPARDDRPGDTRRDRQGDPGSLRTTLDEIRLAADRLHGKDHHKGRNTTLLLTGIALGILFNPVTIGEGVSAPSGGAPSLTIATRARRMSALVSRSTRLARIATVA